MDDYVQNIMSEAKKLEDIQVKSSVNDEIKSEEINEKKKEEIQVNSSIPDEMKSDEINEMKKEKLEKIEIKSSTPDEIKSNEISERKKDEVMKTNENKATVTLDEIKDDSSKDIAMVVVDEVKVDETDKMSTASETDNCSVSSSVIESYVNHVLATATEQTVTHIAVSKQENKEHKVIPLPVNIKPDVLLQEADVVKDASRKTIPATEIKVPESKPKTIVVKEQNEISTAVSSSETSPNSNPTTDYNKDTIAEQKSVSDAATDEHLRCKVEQQSVAESTISPKSEFDGPSNTDPTVNLQENIDSTADTVSLMSVSSSVVLEYVGNVLDTVKGELTSDEKVESNQIPDIQKDCQSHSLTQNDMQRTSEKLYHKKKM
ncbi:unnamed protein product [Mytilus coruscus]|uniref:Uncharacterized protein n=1 Tax=Mytilus coruscus TaxID=42192 RepID=A0A6J8AKZ6_MYTCO|nr:unnamed protein product [Mytilus coruscus]